RAGAAPCRQRLRWPPPSSTRWHPSALASAQHRSAPRTSSGSCTIRSPPVLDCPFILTKEVNNPTTMLSLVADGIGVTFTITSAEKTKPDSVVLRKADDLRGTAELSAIWREDKKIPPSRSSSR